jgi:hypothetical protein
MSDEGGQWAQNVLIERRAFGFPGRRIETAGLPDPHFEDMLAPVDDESILDERRYQNGLERTIDKNASARAHVSDLVRIEMERQQSRFIAADRQLRPAVGSGGDEGMHFQKLADEPYDPAPKPAAGYIVAMMRRHRSPINSTT